MPLDKGAPGLDDWQELACEKLAEGKNVIIDAPTSAGKTRVVEHFFESSMHLSGFRAAYTAPVKSLSNDKLREFRKRYGNENVGISTGDFKENLDAPLVVATLESYRNSLLGVEPDLNRSLVVFDEYHYIQDHSRGSAWEEAIILTPPTCQLLLLSASVNNADEFCSWIESISPRNCVVVSTRHRPVPLKNIIYHQKDWLLAGTFPLPRRRGGNEDFRAKPNLAEIASNSSKLVPMGLTPCIVYSGMRLSCEHLAFKLAEELPELSPKRSKEIAAVVAENLPGEQIKLMRSDLYKILVKFGVAFHHSGMTPQSRVVIEILIKEGKLHFCTATMGLSLGINFSVKSTMVSDFVRPGDFGITPYRPSEVLQMMGRAGRRGLDNVGYSLWPSLSSYRKFAQAKRESCPSRLKNDPTTFLGLIDRSLKLRDIETFYKKSFMRFQHKSFSCKLVKTRDLESKLKTSLPCDNPSYAYARYISSENSECHECPLIKPCHKVIQNTLQNDLGMLHIHLCAIGCIDTNNQLTSFGSLARHLPQSGGLVLADLINRGIINETNLLAGLEIMGSLCLAHYKSPRARGKSMLHMYPVEENLYSFYPDYLFPDLYESNYDHEILFKEFNPKGGLIVREWAMGASWDEMVNTVVSQKFSQGDLMALISRSMTYLQSLSQAQLPGISQVAKSLRQEMQREPLVISI